MFSHVKNYIKPSSTKPQDGGTLTVPMPPMPPPPVHTNSNSRINSANPSRRNTFADSQRFSQMRADILLELMAKTQEANMWISSNPPPGEGAIFKVSPGEFISRPASLKQSNHPFYLAGLELNAKVRYLQVSALSLQMLIHVIGLDNDQRSCGHLSPQPRRTRLYSHSR